MATTHDNNAYDDLDSIPDDSNYETVMEGYTSVTYNKDRELILVKKRARRNERDDAQVKDARGRRQCTPRSCRMPCWAIVLIVIGLLILIAAIVGIVLFQGQSIRGQRLSERCVCVWGGGGLYLLISARWPCVTFFLSLPPSLTFSPLARSLSPTLPLPLSPVYLPPLLPFLYPSPPSLPHPFLSIITGLNKLYICRFSP